MTEPSADTIEQCRRGDTRAFASVFERYERPLFAYVYRMLGDPSDCEPEDVVQEVFLKAYRNIHGFQPQAGGSFTAWIFSIARHHCISLVRRSGIRKRHQEEIDQEAWSTRTDILDPHETLILQEDLAGVRQAIGTLSEPVRSAFILRYYHDMPYADIARILESTEAAVRLRVCRARKELFQQLNTGING